MRWIKAKWKAANKKLTEWDKRLKAWDKRWGDKLSK